MADDSQKQPIADLGDETLIRQIAVGDSQALEMLYQRHGLTILRYLLGLLSDRHQAEDALQEVMVAVWRGASGFRGQISVQTWLIGIARHRALTLRQRTDTTISLNEDDPIASDMSPPIDSLMHESDSARLRTAIQHLPEAQRETLELLFYHSLSGPEAAHVLGVAP